MSNHSNVEVRIDASGIDRSLKKFKRMCESCGIVREYRMRKEYRKPSVKKKEKTESAQKRAQKLERKMSRGPRRL
jgi:small subunit ribosomal protein S21